MPKDKKKGKPRIKSVTIAGGMPSQRIPRRYIAFKEGVNLLIGPNGSGKSAVLKNIVFPAPHDKKNFIIDAEPGKFFAFDFEHDNPRIQGYIESASQVSSLFASHGETNRAVLDVLRQKAVRNCIVMLDEPEQALDVDAISNLVNILKESPASQIILATHCPTLIIDPDFNIIELEDDYKKKVIDHVIGLTQKLVDTVTETLEDK